MIIKSRLFAESWNVAWRCKNENKGILDDQETQFHIIPNSIHYWAADPFLFEYKKETYIFAELYDYILARGCIGYCKIVNGKTTRWKKVITEDYHLSYPNIFSDESGVYILPESSAAEELYLYKAVEFPDKWEKHLVLKKNVKYVDSVFMPSTENCILCYDIGTEKYELKILDIDKNVEVSIFDNEYNLQRPAGKYFVYDKVLYRPAQICQNDYGQGIVIYKISDEPYKEEKILQVLPETLSYNRKIFLDGLHTYNSSELYEVVDIKTRRFNIINFLFRFRGLISRNR